MAGKTTGTLSPEEMTKMQRLRFDLNDALELCDYDVDALLQVVEEMRLPLPAYKKATDEYFENLLISRRAGSSTEGHPEKLRLETSSSFGRDTLIDPKGRDIYPPDTAELNQKKWCIHRPQHRRRYLK